MTACSSEEARNWFLSHSSGSLVCVRDDGVRKEFSSFPAAHEFFIGVEDTIDGAESEEGEMKELSDHNKKMRNSMLMHGALLMSCPHCGQETPVYAANKEGGCVSTMCLYCEGRIQVAGELRPVKEKVPEMDQEPRRTLVRYWMGIGIDAKDMENVVCDLQDKQFENIPDARKFMHEQVDAILDAWVEMPRK